MKRREPALNSRSATLIRAMRAALMLVLMLCGKPVLAQSYGGAVTQVATARSVIVTPASLVKSADMNFGKIANTTAAATVVMDPVAGTCATTGSILHVGACAPAVFNGLGIRNMTVRINLPNTITLTGPGQQMTVTNLTMNTAPDLQLIGNGNGGGNGNPRYQILPTSGIFDFSVGGTLNVNANQAAGTYSGTFTVSVVYQ